MRARHSLIQDSRARFGFAVLAIAVLVALLAPLLAVDPSIQRDIVATRFLPPMSADVHGTFHLLGTDRFGRDVWARLAYGARVSLGVGVLAVLLSVAIGFYSPGTAMYAYFLNFASPLVRRVTGRV